MLAVGMQVALAPLVYHRYREADTPSFIDSALALPRWSRRSRAAVRGDER